MKTDAAVTALGALAHPSRLAIFRVLVKRGPEGYTPGDLAKKIEIPAPTLSFHLKELQRAGLVTPQREGRFLFYSANFDTMHGLVEFLTANCCALSDATCDTNCIPTAVKATRKRA